MFALADRESVLAQAPVLQALDDLQEHSSRKPQQEVQDEHRLARQEVSVIPRHKEPTNVVPPMGRGASQQARDLGAAVAAAVPVGTSGAGVDLIV